MWFIVKSKQRIVVYSPYLSRSMHNPTVLNLPTHAKRKIVVTLRIIESSRIEQHGKTLT
jgi:hypothetical protein